MKTQGKNLTWLAATLGVHHQTVASWHCDQRRIPAARLEQVRSIVSGLE
jgi:DNA-binding transcriptional regulator YdaS (Cro superfamily)